jgi:diguanylate cyclase (GGDEF)-like protein/PAS domain S-box-containing protein
MGRTQQYFRGATDASLVTEDLQLLTSLAFVATNTNAPMPIIRGESTRVMQQINSSLDRLHDSGLEQDEVRPLGSLVHDYFKTFEQVQERVEAGDQAGGQRLAVVASAQIVPITRLAHLTVVDFRQHADRVNANTRVITIGIGVGVVGLVGSLLMFVERRRRNDARRQAKFEERARFEEMVQNSTDLVIVTDHAGEVLYVSPSSTMMLGWQPERIKAGGGLRAMVDDEDLDGLLTSLDRLSCDAGAQISGHVGVKTVDGVSRTLEYTAMALNRSTPQAVVWNARDVTERCALEDELRNLAFHDSLTGLANRTLLIERLDKAFGETVGDDHAVALIMLDIDGFKDVNDTLGHEVGDEVIMHTAKRFLGAARAGDTVARFGGDEFAILLLDDTTPAVALEVADRVRHALSEPINIHGRRVVLTTSAGIAFAHVQSETPRDLISHADLALYAAKAAGKATLSVYDPDMQERANERLELGIDIGRAVEFGQLRVHYQPIIDLAHGGIGALEALVRWEHPEHGTLGPDTFIALAEASGAIVSVGNWILREVCRQVAAWNGTGILVGVPVHVNVSAQQLAEPAFVADVRKALTDYALSPDVLVVEITESELVRHAGRVRAGLADLHKAGIGIALDDFGTGYSSLSYLAQFPVDIVKIDKTFVRAPRTFGQRDLLGPILAFANELGLTIVTEGVEEREQVDRLIAAGCHMAQGFFFSRPVPPEEIAHQYQGEGARPVNVIPLNRHHVAQQAT